MFMSRNVCIATVLAISIFLPYQLLASVGQPLLKLKSPNGVLSLRVGLNSLGAVWYDLQFGKELILEPSTLGYSFKKHKSLRSGLRLLKIERNAVDEYWKTIWGEKENIRNNYKEAVLHFQESRAAKRKLSLIFRVYDDGVAFHYHVPKQQGVKKLVITAEHSQFAFKEDLEAWWIPNNYDTYEELYRHTRLSEIGKDSAHSAEHTHSSGQKNFTGTNTPITLRTSKGTHIALHEARLVDYAGMTLVHSKGKNKVLESELVPWPNGDKVRVKLPFRSPWRTIQVADRPGGLVESSLILNLNDPCKLTDCSFIKPMKYIGIWWSMHLGITTWGKEGGRHGATTAETKRYIDFAAHNGIRGVLVEGWNTGWESWYKDDNFDFHTAYSDFDLKELAKYARRRGVELVGHHETGGQIESYERCLEKAFDLYRQHGIRAVKTGYAGKIRPKGVFHHSQRMVRHYRHVLETAARYGLMVDAHEPIKDTGLRRTFPNMMTREGVRGMEWNAWSRGNPPDHHVNLVFTRMLSGPLDYTPGIFDLRFERYKHQYRFWNAIDGLKTKGRMHTTLAKQLALFVVFYSPLQMASDLPENYEGHPAFQFIRDVPVDWSDTKVLSGRLGEYAIIARRERGTNNWFVGAITNEHSRKMPISLSFLTKGASYLATMYADGPTAHYHKNPGPVTIERRMVSNEDEIELHLAPGGGQAISFKAVQKDHP